MLCIINASVLFLKKCFIIINNYYDYSWSSLCDFGPVTFSKTYPTDKLVVMRTLGDAVYAG